MFVLFYLLLGLIAFAQEPVQNKDLVEEVSEDKSLTVFVAPIKIVNNTNLQIFVGNDSIIGYSSTHYRSAKVRVNGSIKPINEVYKKVKFYDRSTIEMIHQNCNYKREPRKCAVKNNHYTLIPTIEVNDYQLIVRLILYDSEMQIVGMGVKTDNKTIRYIRQQEVTVVETEGRMGRQTVTHYGKEQLPLKWEIPHKLLNRHIYQATLGLWVGRIL